MRRPWLVKALVVVVLLCARQAAAAPFAYVANSGVEPGSISIIDLATNNVVATIPLAAGSPDPDPYWAAINPSGTVVAVSLHSSAGVAIINGVTNTLLGVVGGVGDEPEAVAVSSDGKTVYVADEFGDLYIIDVATLMVTGSVDIDADTDVCDGAENMVISPDDRFLYITCEDGNTTIRVDTMTLEVTKIADVGEHGIALNCPGTRLYVSDGTDVLEYNTRLGTFTGKVLPGCDMYGGRVSPDGRRFYCVEESDNLRIYDLHKATELVNLTLNDFDATAVGVSADSSRVYVPISNDDAVDVVNAETLKLLANNITVGDRPRGIAIANPCPFPIEAPASGSWSVAAIVALLSFLGAGLCLRRVRG
jgi:YVTN family beta-propeller protein